MADLAPGNESTKALQAWNTPFWSVGDPADTRHPVPERTVSVTSHAWQALTSPKGTPDIIAPGFDGLASAILLRNLVLTLPGRPKVVVFDSGRALTAAYHALEYPHLGRWSDAYPMHFKGPAGEAVPLRKRGRDHKRAIVHRAFTLDDVEHWAKTLDDPAILYLVDSPSDLPAERPRRAFALLRGVLARDPSHTQRVRRPCTVVRPKPTSVSPPAKHRGQSWPFLVREANVSVVRSGVEVVPSEDGDLAALHALYRVLSRESWEDWGAFLATCRNVSLRLHADLFPQADATVSRAGASTDALVHLLDAFVRAGRAPGMFQAREFVAYARRVHDRRRAFASGKATWVQTHASTFTGPDAPDVILDPHNASRGRKHFSRVRADGSRAVRVEPYTTLRAPRTAGVLVGCAPNSKLLQDVLQGATPAATFLVYPWEARTLGAAAQHLRRSARALGADLWAEVATVDVPEDDPRGRSTVLTPRPLVDLVEDAEDTLASSDGLPPDPTLHDETPKVRVSTSIGSHVFPTDRVVIVLRGGVFHEVPAGNVTPGDTLVAPKGGGHPSAHEVIARICRRNTVMEETRVAAASWRQMLRDHVARHHKGQAVTEVHKALGLSISYFQFRFWLKEDEPIAPRHDNLRELLAALGYGKDFADLVERAAVTHRAHRRDIYRHLLSLSNARLDDLYAQVGADDEADPDYGVTVEDLINIVQFERVTATETIQHAQ